MSNKYKTVAVETSVEFSTGQEFLAFGSYRPEREEDRNGPREAEEIFVDCIVGENGEDVEMPAEELERVESAIREAALKLPR